MTRGQVAGQFPCRVPGCSQLIIMAVSESGQLIPVDADSAGQPGGSLAVWRQDGKPHGKLFARVLGQDENPDPARGEHRGTSHWSTCVNADAARRTCSECGHKAHPGAVCKRQGRVECRQVAAGDTVARVRGRWPCGCKS